MTRWSGFAAATALLSVSLQACADRPSAANDQKRSEKRVLQYPVEAVTVEARGVEYSISAVGSVEAFERVLVTARVPGVIEKVRFTEGDVVKEGQVLVEIEPDRYRLAVEQTRAALQRAEVEKADAEVGLKRRVTLQQKDTGLMRAEEVENWRTQVGVATAELAERRAMLQMSELNLRDALVQAPIAGAIQTRTAATGQYVQAGTTLATLVRREPLLLRFQVPEQDAARLKSGLKASFLTGDSERSFTAVLTHVAEFANVSSRLVPVTARIDDEQRSVLRPGIFARVTVPIGTASNAAVIPQTAIRPSEKGFLAYVVDGETARERVLVLGMRTLDGQVEVRSGIQPGELLVVRGAEALRDGAAVTVVKAMAANDARAVAATPSVPETKP